jgi:hypothetical protein
VTADGFNTGRNDLIHSFYQERESSMILIQWRWELQMIKSLVGPNTKKRVIHAVFFNDNVTLWV